MEVLQFRVLKGGFGRFAGFVLGSRAKFSLSTRRGFAETSSLYLAVSNTQGFVRGYLRNVVSWFSFNMRGSQV